MQIHGSTWKSCCRDHTMNHERTLLIVGFQDYLLKLEGRWLRGGLLDLSNLPCRHTICSREKEGISRLNTNNCSVIMRYALTWIIGMRTWVGVRNASFNKYRVVIEFSDLQNHTPCWKQHFLGVELTLKTSSRDRIAWKLNPQRSLWLAAFSLCTIWIQ